MDATHEQPRALGAIVAQTLAFFGRHAAALLRVYALVCIPLVVLQVLTQQHGAGNLAAISPGAADTSPAEVIAAVRRMLERIAPLLALGTIFVPFANNVLLITAAGLAGDVPPDWRDVLVQALRRWPQAILALIVVALGFTLLAIAAFAAIAAVALVVLLLAKAAAAALGAVLIGVATLLVWGCACAFDVVVEMAFCVVATEEPHPLRAVAIVLRRCLDRRLRRRTAIIGLVLGAVELTGTAAFTSAGDLLAGVTHLESLGLVCAAAGGVLLNALLLTFMFFYVRDARVRLRGPEPLAGIATSAAPAPAPAPAEFASAAAVRNDGLNDDERVSIEQFLERRETLSPEARREGAARIAADVRPKLRASFAHLDDEALFEHLTRP